MMAILIACEESQRVCCAFRSFGIEAFSCDILDCSGDHPEWHIKNDVLSVLHNPSFLTCDGVFHSFSSWDCVISFPPCTYLTNTGNRWFNVSRYGDRALLRYSLRNDAFDFFLNFLSLDCPFCVENPVGYVNRFFKPSQIIQPFLFGDPERKTTCLWLHDLPLLKPTDIVSPNVIHYKNGHGSDSPWHMSTMNLPSQLRSIARSKTFPGVALAMASQWYHLFL